jgi:crotonobetainyl-CoA:carnitine CoA-transferase CaiB-like acyl-CoA transferase
MPHPRAGTVKTIANPLRLSATPLSGYRHAPMLGEHNDEITARFGPGVAPVAPSTRPPPPPPLPTATKD